MKKVLITDDCHPLLIQGFVELGYACDYLPEITYDETFQCISAYEGLIINSKILVNQGFIDRAERLRFVGRLGSGMEIVDRVYAAQKGIAVFSSPEGNRNAVAEQALGMLLALSNQLMRADREVRQQIWEREKNRGWELRGKTIGIIGFGHTGSQFAKKFAGMEMQVLAYDKYIKVDTSGMDWLEAVDVSQIQKQADIISLHLPLTPETKHFVDAGFIQACKPGFVLINTSRGACVHTADLLDALETGKVGGACLDVFENEKPTTFTESDKLLFNRFAELNQVVLSPHIAGWTHESKQLLAEILLNKIKEVL